MKKLRRSKNKEATPNCTVCVALFNSGLRDYISLGTTRCPCGDKNCKSFMCTEHRRLQEGSNK